MASSTPMPESRKKTRRLYFFIFFLLTIFTVIEIIVPELKLPYLAHASSLTLIAFVKAAMVGWYYMHLNHESNWLRFISLLPIFALAYAAMVVVESVVR